MLLDSTREKKKYSPTVTPKRIKKHIEKLKKKEEMKL